MRKYQGEVHQTTGSLQFIWKLYSIFLKIIHILDLICSPEQKSTKALKRSRQSKYSRITCCLGQGQYWLENQKAILFSCSWSNSTSVSDSLHQTYLCLSPQQNWGMRGWQWCISYRDILPLLWFESHLKHQWVQKGPWDSTCWAMCTLSELSVPQGGLGPVWSVSNTGIPTLQGRLAAVDIS